MNLSQKGRAEPQFPYLASGPLNVRGCMQSTQHGPGTHWGAKKGRTLEVAAAAIIVVIIVMVILF